MKITCIAVGKKHDAELNDAIAEFEKRLSGFCDFAWQLVPTSTKDSESEAIMRQLKPEDVVVLLDERGKLYDNLRIARKLEALQNQSTKRLVIIIGGAFGVNESLRRYSNYVVSFSPLVFPHQIMRLLVVEQLYRSYSIVADGKYHHI